MNRGLEIMRLACPFGPRLNITVLLVVVSVIRMARLTLGACVRGVWFIFTICPFRGSVYSALCHFQYESNVVLLVQVARLRDSACIPLDS
jgi:hypothetical protein